MDNNKEEKIERPRGRPKSSEIPSMIVEGMKSRSGIKCGVCARVFPRQKSLQAHITTHYDLKKYQCNFFHCNKCFKQSSQLKNHLYIHSREKPFKCPFEDCQVRFPHPTRTCPSHPSLKLIKKLETADEIRKSFYQNGDNISEAKKHWLEKYLAERERRLQRNPVEQERKENEVEFNGNYSEYLKKRIELETKKLQFIKRESEIIDGLILWMFLKYVHEQGENSKALFEQSCHHSKNV